MGITKAQALTEDKFHYNLGCTEAKPERWRRNGQTKTWKRDTTRFQLPIKYGLRDYSYITEDNAHEFHLESDCPNGHNY